MGERFFFNVILRFVKLGFRQYRPSMSFLHSGEIRGGRSPAISVALHTGEVMLSVVYTRL